MDIAANHFQNPHAFWLLLALPLLIAHYVWRSRRKPHTLRFPGTALAKQIRPGWTVHLRHLLPIMRWLAFTLLVIALARPQGRSELERISTEGVDIMLVLDVSGSMDQLDMIGAADWAVLRAQNAEKVWRSGTYRPYTRLGIAKSVIEDFIAKRRDDRLGLTIFATSAYTQCPLTLDGGMLADILRSVNDSTLDGRATAIGDGLMNALVRLQDSKAKSRVVVLLTDGKDNASEYPPTRAAEAAKALGVKVYTIGVGKKSGDELAFTQNPFTGSISWGSRPMAPEEGVDEDALRSIAQTTGGQFFRAQDDQELASIYDTIDKLEKTEIQSYNYAKYSEEFYPWLLAGALLLVLELLLAHTRLTRIP